MMPIIDVSDDTTGVIHLLLRDDAVKVVRFVMICLLDLSGVFSARNGSLHIATNTMGELSFHVSQMTHCNSCVQ